MNADSHGLPLLASLLDRSVCFRVHPCPAAFIGLRQWMWREKGKEDKMDLFKMTQKK